MTPSPIILSGTSIFIGNVADVPQGADQYTWFSYQDPGFSVGQENGFVGPFQVSSSDPAVVTAESGKNNAVRLLAHKAGLATLTVTGYREATATALVTVTTATLHLHFAGVHDAQTFTVDARGEGVGAGSGTPRQLAAGFGDDSTYTIRNWPATASGNSLSPLSEFHVVVSNGTINVVDRRYSFTIVPGNHNEITLEVTPSAE